MSDRPDLSVQAWKPGPALSQAMFAALSQLATVWPKVIGPALEQNEAGQGMMANFAFAMRNTDLRAIPGAAREWIATESYAPKPAEFAKLARSISDTHFPRIHSPQSHAPVDAPPIDKNTDRVTALSKRAYQTFGTWGLVSDVWEIAWKVATTPEMCQDVRNGNIPDEVWDAAVANIVRREADKIKKRDEMRRTMDALAERFPPEVAA